MLSALWELFVIALIASTFVAVVRLLWIRAGESIRGDGRSAPRGTRAARQRVPRDDTR